MLGLPWGGGDSASRRIPWSLLQPGISSPWVPRMCMAGKLFMWLGPPCGLTLGLLVSIQSPSPTQHGSCPLSPVLRPCQRQEALAPASLGREGPAGVEVLTVSLLVRTPGSVGLSQAEDRARGGGGGVPRRCTLA